MITRILYTDGKVTVGIYWVEHTGSDIYFGLYKADGKRTYHASGKQHMSYGGKKEDLGMGVPLKDFKEVLPLSSISVGDMTERIKVRGTQEKYSGRKSDNVLMLDGRTMPRSAKCHIEVGLVEPGKLSSLEIRIKNCTIAGRALLAPQQVLIATSETPWIYVIGSWLLPQPDRPELS